MILSVLEVVQILIQALECIDILNQQSRGIEDCLAPTNDQEKFVVRTLLWAEFSVLNILLGTSSQNGLNLKDIIWTVQEQGFIVTRVEPVLRMDFLLQFLDQADLVQQKHPSKHLIWDIAFHGTLLENCGSIIQYGFRLPYKNGHESRYFSHWGDGIYSTPCITVSYDYTYPSFQIPSQLPYIPCNKAVPIFLCAVVRGHALQCQDYNIGRYRQLEKGYDSHEWKNEWVVFDDRKIIPLCLFWVKCTRPNFPNGTRLRAGSSKNVPDDPSWVQKSLVTPVYDERHRGRRGIWPVNERSASIMKEYHKDLKSRQLDSYRLQAILNPTMF